MTPATIEQLRARLRTTPAETVVMCDGLTIKLREMTAGGFLSVQEPYQTLAFLGKRATSEDRANALRKSNIALVRGRVAEPDLSGLTDDELLSMPPQLWNELVAACNDQGEEADPEAALKNFNGTEGDELPSV